MPKLAELEIVKRGYPLLIVATFDSPAHISDAMGRDKSGYYYVTRCNRALLHPDIIHFRGEYKTCPRCGTSQDFEAALQEKEQFTLRRAQEEKEEKERCKRETEAEWQRVEATYESGTYSLEIDKTGHAFHIKKGEVILASVGACEWSTRDTIEETLAREAVKEQRRRLQELVDNANKGQKGI